MADVRLSLSHAHHLDSGTLRARIEQRVQHYVQRYPQLNLSQHYQWLDATHVRATYRGGKAEITLDAGDVRVDLDLPFFARLYRGRIEDFIRREMAAVTAPAETARGAAGT
jgi:hypothetical protein